MLRFFAGCEPLDGKVIAGEGEDNKEIPNKEIQDNKTPEPTSKKRKIAYVVFPAIPNMKVKIHNVIIRTIHFNFITNPPFT